MPHVPPAWRRFAFNALIAAFHAELLRVLVLALLIALPSLALLTFRPAAALAAGSAAEPPPAPAEWLAPALSGRPGLAPAVVPPRQSTIAAAADAAADPAEPYRCDGDPLAMLLVRGAVDDPAIPDPSAAPVPVGGFVVLRWRELSLQLPRTNNAGPASFTDGRWWWSLEDPTHPRFRLRRALGDVQDFRCEPA